MRKYIQYLLIIIALIGIVDASYLTWEHFQNTVLPCTANPIFSDCGKVLRSDYAVVFDVPLALIGVIHYSIFTGMLILAVIARIRFARFIAVFLSLVGFVSSLYFAYLQLFVIHAICLYCMVSAITSTLLFILTLVVFAKERKHMIIYFVSLLYKYLMKPLFFTIDAETIHTHMTYVGEILGRVGVVKVALASMFTYQNESLRQEIVGITFKNPIGLAAGFDYEARLTQVLPVIGFGFETVGTITNYSYQGNPRPMLGRLPKSQSLMVNKGFKNQGAKRTITKLTNLKFTIPLGISIGRTNTKELTTQKQSIEDILQAFTSFEQAKVKHSYYELNISCPNLYGEISFYPSKNLHELLTEIDKLKLSRPLFIKMPIEKSGEKALDMLKIIAKHSPKGVIYGNLQKDRKHPALDPVEVSKYPVGNFSGKPTFERSNELIRLTYQHYKDRFIIIGCGGVFSAEDAYNKITLGASLVQLITGMIFVGPQLIAEINIKLTDLLKKDGFMHISQAIGSENKYAVH